MNNNEFLKAIGESGAKYILGLIKSVEEKITTHTGKTSGNPHGVDKSDVGLENVINEKQYCASNPQPNVSGSSGSCTGNSATATKLKTARTIRTNLSSTSTASFDGTANATPGVTGILPLANGGTGAGTAADARANMGLGNVNNTADSAKPVSKAQQAAIDAVYAQAIAYADQVVANLINGAPTTLDTLKEVADAMEENEDVVAALDEAVGSKVNQAEFDSHESNTTVHITASERTAWNGKLNASGGDSKAVKTTFASGDSTSPTAWTDVAVLTSGMTHANLFNRISTMFKNVRWLYKMLGTTDISAIGDGTATGAISELNNALPYMGYANITLSNQWESHVKIDLSHIFSSISYVFVNVENAYYTAYGVINTDTYKSVVLLVRNVTGAATESIRVKYIVYGQYK